MEKNPSGDLIRSQCKMYDLDYSSVSWANSTTNKTVECQFGYRFYLEEGQTTAIADVSVTSFKGIRRNSDEMQSSEGFTTEITSIQDVVYTGTINIA